jgi:hypothetical protein
MKALLFRFTVAVGLSAIALFVRIGEANACSIISVPDVQQRISRMVQDKSSVTLIGRVTAEKSASRDAFGVLNHANARMRVDAVLKKAAGGPRPEREIEVRPGCVGPDLRLGEHLLLVVWWQPASFNGRTGEYSDYAWTVSNLGGKIFLGKDDAFLEDVESRAGFERLGTAEQTVRWVAELAGSSSTQTSLALDVLGAPEASRPAVPLAGPGITLSVFALFAVFLRRSQNTEERPS